MGHVVACDQRRIHAGGDGRENNHIATSVAPADQGTVFRIGQDVSDAAGERRVFLPDRIGVSESHMSFIGFSTLKSGTRVPTVMPLSETR